LQRREVGGDKLGLALVVRGGLGTSLRGVSHTVSFYNLLPTFFTK
jgi:hypothetical protein